MKKTKDTIIFMIILMSIILITPTISQAALQSNGNTPATNTLNNWICIVRQMQMAGGTLGLTNSIDWNSAGGKFLTSDNPNLDIHMEKNTEYGAMAILSASSYGNPNPVGDGGNQTGVRVNFNKEWVAGLNSMLDNQQFNYISARYKNIYVNDAKIGDATIETKGWHGYANSYWFNNKRYVGMVRSYSSSIFSYHGNDDAYGRGDAVPTKKWATRAVIVVGSGV